MVPAPVSWFLGAGEAAHYNACSPGVTKRFQLGGSEGGAGTMWLENLGVQMHRVVDVEKHCLLVILNATP